MSKQGGVEQAGRRGPSLIPTPRPDCLVPSSLMFIFSLTPTGQAVDARANLDKYRNAKGISSDSLFEREEESPAWDMN